MAHFYGTVQGHRGEASRLGTRRSGLRATASGWNIGGQLDMEHVADKDRVCLLVRDGSNGPGSMFGCIAMREREEDHHAPIRVVQVDSASLLAITDDAWREVFKHEDVAARLRTLLFFDGKAVP